MSIDNRDLKQLISILQKMIVDNDTDDEQEEQPPKTIPAPKKPTALKTRSKKVADTEHFNKFSDMPEKNMHKEDTLIDKKLNVNGPTPRSRSFNFVDVVCRVCGKKESVNPVLIDSVSRYKCNSCSTSSG